MINNLKKPFFIAEISCNHCGNLHLAKKLISEAKKNGASAVKLQTYEPDNMTFKSNKKYFKIQSGLWKNWNLWDLYKKAHTPYSWHRELFNYAKKKKIKIFSTPFDNSGVDLLEKLNCKMYKVASFEITDLPLIERISKTKKPVIISTGMSNLKEIDQAYNIMVKGGAKKIALLYCVSNYPSKNSDFNLNNINLMKSRYGCEIGLSDHSKNNFVAINAAAIGAKIFEKHIALKGQKKGLDIEFSLKGPEIKDYVDDINNSHNLFKKNKFTRSKSEQKNLFLRRSIYAIKQIKKGEKFTPKNIKCLRPAVGLDPSYFKILLKKKNNGNLNPGDPIYKRNIK